MRRGGSAGSSQEAASHGGRALAPGRQRRHVCGRLLHRQRRHVFGASHGVDRGLGDHPALTVPPGPAESAAPVHRTEPFLPEGLRAHLQGMGGSLDGEPRRGWGGSLGEVMANVPDLATAVRADDFGWDAAISTLLQRSSNSGEPFLTLELRTGWVGGSNTFWNTLGNEDVSTLIYAAPSMHLSVLDRVSLGAAGYFDNRFESPGLRLNVSLSNRSREKDETG